jgi:hypothetical protein
MAKTRKPLQKKPVPRMIVEKQEEAREHKPSRKGKPKADC